MYTATRSGDTLEMLLYDDIGEGFFGGIASGQVVKDIRENADAANVSVSINSPGGDVFEGFAIYNALANHSGRVVVEVDALAASIASVIAMAGDDIRIAPNAMMMIHNPWTLAMGDSRELRRVAELLDQVQGNIVSVYDRLDGDAQAAMDAETWYTATEAVDAGLADSISETSLQVAAATFDPKRFRNTPERFKPQTEQPSSLWKRKAAERQLRLTSGRGMS